MAIRDILLPLVSYPRPTTVVAIEKCVAIAANLGAQISATAVELEVPAPAGPFKGAFVADGTAASEEAGEHRKSLLNSTHMLEGLEAAASAAKVAYTLTITSCAADEIAASVVSQSRLKDVSLVPVKGQDGGQENVIEALLFESGRPVLLFAETLVGELADSFDRVAIAWDHSAQAARAVSDALPFLKKAKSVRVLTVADKATVAQCESGASLIKYLNQHGIEASFDTPEVGDRSIGKVLETYVKANKIDLLVMGAYRHSPLREFVMGGATYAILGHPPCWVLMAH